MAQRARLAETKASCVFAVLVAGFLAIAPNLFVNTTGAAERLLSDAQLTKINGWIAERGNTSSVNPIITEILGLTHNDETISSQALAVRDDQNTDEIHQIAIIAGGKGYLADHFHQDKVEVYWADKDLVLINAVTGVHGGRPEATSIQEAQAGFRTEMA